MGFYCRQELDVAGTNTYTGRTKAKCFQVLERDKMATVTQKQKHAYIATYISTVVVVSVGLSLLLYIPIWNHNLFVLAIAGLCSGIQFALVSSKGNTKRAIRSLVGNLVMMWAVWNHNVPVIVITVAVIIGFGIYKMLKKLRSRL